MQESPDKYLLQRTIVFTITSVVLMAVWGLADYLFNKVGGEFFLLLRLGYSGVMLLLLLVYRALDFPIRYRNLVGALVFYLAVLVTLPLIIMSQYDLRFLLGFATIFYGTAVLMVWPLRFMFYPILISYAVLGMFSLHQLKDVNFFYTITVLAFNVGGLSMLASWISWKNYRNNSMLLEQLNQLTLTDKLTGLNNRRYFDMYMNNVLQHAVRNRSDITVMMLDVDFFKLYNDNYGHQQGDVCLTRTAQCLKRSLVRKTDFLARYGGEEFIIVLNDTGPGGAEIIAQRILDNMKQENMVHEYSSVAPYVTLSIGIVSVEAEKEHTVDWLVREADSRLYKAKQSGRNRFVSSRS